MTYSVLIRIFFKALSIYFAVSVPAIKGLESLKPLLSGLGKDTQEEGL